jgi:hypothetical protein
LKFYKIMKELTLVSIHFHSQTYIYTRNYNSKIPFYTPYFSTPYIGLFYLMTVIIYVNELDLSHMRKNKFHWTVVRKKEA